MMLTADVLAAPRLSPSALARQREQRWAALAAAAMHAPAWRERLQQSPQGKLRLQDQPVLQKRELMQDFEGYLTEPLRRADVEQWIADPGRIAFPLAGRYTVWESSGSSGAPGIYVQDAQAMAIYDCLEALRPARLRPLQSWFDPFGIVERTAFVGAIDGHFASTVTLRRLARQNPWLAARIDLLSFLRPMAETVAALNRRPPTVLATYPSMAVLLAEEFIAGRLRHPPRELWTGGETLTPAVRTFLEQGFGCPVTNSYGCSEFLALAAECSQQRLHLNSDWAILEAVDADGAEVPPGTWSHSCWLTNLANHLQPLIRYELGDRIRYADQPCRCGSNLPVIEVMGRSDDVLRLPGGQGAMVAISPLALTTVLEDDAGLCDFQLLAEASQLRLQSSCAGAKADAALQRGRQALEAFLSAQGVTAFPIACSSGQAPLHGASGKIQRVMVLAGGTEAKARTRKR